MATRRRVWLPRNPLLALWTPRGTTGTMAPDRGLSPGSAPPAPGQSPPSCALPGLQNPLLRVLGAHPTQDTKQNFHCFWGRPTRPAQGNWACRTATTSQSPHAGPGGFAASAGTRRRQGGPREARLWSLSPALSSSPGPHQGPGHWAPPWPRQAHRHPGPGPGHLAGRAAGFQPISRLQGQGWSHSSSQPCQSGLDLGSESQPAPLGSHPPVHPAPQGDVAGLSEQQALAGPWPPPQGQTWAVGERPRSLLPEGEGLAPRPPGGAGEGSRGSSSSWPGPRLWQP